MIAGSQGDKIIIHEHHQAILLYVLYKYKINVIVTVSVLKMLCSL